jgi:sphingomyelin phosphodiesterase
VPADKNKAPIKVALISDLHLDYDYTPGSNAACGAPLCCRSDSGPATSPDDSAGVWGDYRCDVPVRTVQSMLDFVKDELKPDAVFWLGDSVPHNVDSLVFESNVEIMKNVTQLVQSGLQDYKIFPAIGNHDTYPQDSIKFDYPRENEAVNAWAPTWMSFFGNNEEAKQNFLDYGFFSLPFESLNGTSFAPNSKVISLNTNFCYDLNWQASKMFKDPGNMLEWL